MKVMAKYQNKREEVKAKKQNAKIYPIYKMFSWDLLFFYSIQYLFLTTTKGINASDILKVDAFYPLFIIIMQLPSAICSEFLGRKKSIVIGNLFMMFYIISLMAIPGILA